MEDIKKTIDAAVEKIKADPALLKKFNSDPVAALESVTGLDLPDDKVKLIAEGVKAKMAAGQATDFLKKIF